MAVEDYLARVRADFAEAGFALEENLSFRRNRILLVASKIRFDLVAAPTFLEEFFLFCECDYPDEEAVAALCSDGWSYALEHRNPRPPWYAVLLGLVLCTYTVAICPRVNPSLAKAIQNGTPPNHFGLGWEVPLVYDASAGKLYSFQRSQIFGNAFHREMKKVIEKRLLRHCTPE